MNVYASAHPCQMQPHSIFGVERQPFALSWWAARHGYSDKAELFWSLPTLSEVFWGRGRGVNRTALAQAQAGAGSEGQGEGA